MRTDEQALYEQVFDCSLDGVLLTRPDGTILRANAAACRALGRTEAEVCAGGRQRLVREDPALLELLARRLSGAIEGELTFLRPDGTSFPAEFTSGLLPAAEGPRHAYVIFRDVTDKRRTEQALRRTNRALRLVTACNEALVRAESEQALYDAVCQVVAGVGGYRLCWVGVASHDAASSVRPVAQAGADAGYLEQSKVSWADVPTGRGPTGTALRTGRVVVRSGFDDASFDPWVPEATRRGLRSSVALPLVYEGAPLGVISMYSSEFETFDASEQAILQRLADDLARGVRALRDRASRAEAEAASLKTQALLDGVVSAVPEPLFLKDLESRWTFANAATLEVVGKTLEQVLGKTDAELYPDPSVGEALMAVDRRVTTSGVPEVVEERVITPSGPRVYLSTKAPYRDATGRIIGLIGTAHDITERKRAEAERERLATAIEQAAETVLITDARGSIVYVNPAFERASGYSRAEVLGQNPRLLKSGVQDDETYARLWATILSGNTWHGRLVNRHKGGGLFTEEVTVSPVCDPGGVISSFVAVKRDITGHLALEAQLLQSQKMEGIGRLAGGIAHDFNNLLSVIMSLTEVTIDALREGDPMRDDLQEIDKAAHRAAALTRQLLAFSRKQVLQPIALDVNQVLGDMEKMLRRIVGEDVSLEKRLTPDLGVVVADPGQLEQVVMNLAINARDAMTDGGTLTLATRNVDGGERGACVQVEVSDTGPGMDAATQARIFEPFFTTKGLGKGTGLGLSTVYGIVQQSGGTIDVVSSPGAGARVTIPVPRAGAVAAPLPRAVALSRVHGTETVLVVEDDDAVRALTQRILTGAGYDVLGASNAGEALLLFEQAPRPVALVVTDVVMPLMNGRALVERLALVRPGLKALYMSGYTDDAIVQRGVLEPGTHFLPKPFTPGELLRRVREALDSHVHRV